MSSFIKYNSSKVFYSLIFVLILYGWVNRENSNLTPETGLGYMLGIIGGSLMLILMLYPARKKFRFMHHLGLVRHWFKMHMLFGVIGPVAVLFHANFSLGSVNGNVALFSMIIVASSGLIGRYLYAKIHHGLYGKKTSLQELRDELQISKGKLGDSISLSAHAVELIKKSEKFLLRNRNFLIATIMLPFVFLRTKVTKYRLKHNFKRDFNKAGESRDWNREMTSQIIEQATENATAYINSLYRIFRFRIFVHLFSLWHLLHLPLFIMLVVSGIIHVIVVHSY